MTDKISIIILYRALLVFVIYGFIESFLFIKKMKQDHPDEHEKVGNIQIFGNNNPKNGILLFQYITTLQFTKVDDKKFIFNGYRLLIVNALSFILFLAVVITMFME